MTWERPWPWRRTWQDDLQAVDLHDGATQPRGRLTLLAGETSPRTGLLGRVNRWVDDIPVRRWRDRHGALMRGGRALVTLPDGTTGEAWNGRTDGWRRKFRAGHVLLPGRRYDVQHVSRRRTRVLREGTPIATLWRTGLPWRRHDGVGRLRFRIRRDVPALDPWDELAVVVASVACGPAGRPGWWSSLFSELASSG